MTFTPGQIITMTIAVVLIGALIPIGLNSIFDANTSAWDAPSVALWGVLAVVILAAIILVFVPRAGKGT